MRPPIRAEATVHVFRSGDVLVDRRYRRGRFVQLGVAIWLEAAYAIMWGNGLSDEPRRRRLFAQDHVARSEGLERQLAQVLQTYPARQWSDVQWTGRGYERVEVVPPTREGRR